MAVFSSFAQYDAYIPGDDYNPYGSPSVPDWWNSIPIELYVDNVTATTVELSWGYVGLDDYAVIGINEIGGPHGGAIGFSPQGYSLGCDFADDCSALGSPSGIGTSIIITNLKPNTTYEFDMSSFHAWEVNVVQNSNKVQATTSSGSRSYAPRKQTQNSFILSPNPAQNGVTNLSLLTTKDQLVNGLIVDGSGKQVKQFTFQLQKGANTKSIPLDGLNPGLYIVRLGLLEGDIIRKLKIK